MLRKFRERKHGFTIIELLIVIAIIAILAAVAIPALLRAQKSGKESAALQVLKSLRSAEETYRVKNKTYGDLTALNGATLSTVAESGTETASGYVFASTVSASTDAYTITATPPQTDMTTYTMNETGAITP